MQEVHEVHEIKKFKSDQQAQQARIKYDPTNYVFNESHRTNYIYVHRERIKELRKQDWTSTNITRDEITKMDKHKVYEELKQELEELAHNLTDLNKTYILESINHLGNIMTMTIMSRFHSEDAPPFYNLNNLFHKYAFILFERNHEFENKPENSMYLQEYQVYFDIIEKLKDLAYNLCGKEFIQKALENEYIVWTEEEK